MPPAEGTDPTAEHGDLPPEIADYLPAPGEAGDPVAAGRQARYRTTVAAFLRSLPHADEH